MFQAIIDSVSDLATLIAQEAVGFIAAHSSIKKYGVAFFLIKIMVSVFVYLVIIIGIPLAVLFLLVNVVLPWLFT